MAKTQVEDRVVFLLSSLLSSALPMATYVLKYGTAEDRAKLRRLTGTREYEELSRILGEMRR